MEAFIELDSEVNAMEPSFASKSGLHICKTDICAQKNRWHQARINTMIITFFRVEDKNEKSHSFEKSFLLTNMSIDVAFGEFFSHFE